LAANQPELLARHCTEAGLIEKSAELWAKAGQRSLERSALVEAVAQLSRALDQIVSLPTNPERRRERIRLQVALITPLVHVKGYAALETKEAAEQARLLIEQAEAFGEPPEDPLLLFSVLYGFWVANYVAFNGEVVCALAAQFLALAQKQAVVVPQMIGHRLMGQSLLATGDVVRGCAQYNHAIALYDPSQHRPLATRFGQDVGAASLCYRSVALWLLGYPEAAGRDIAQALRDAHEIKHAATLMYTIGHAQLTHIYCGNYAIANALADELVVLADEKSAPIWKALGLMNKGLLFALTGKAADAVQKITSGLTAWRSTGSTLWIPLYLPHLARAYAELGRCEDAQSCIREATSAVENTNERWFESEVHRIAGEIELISQNPGGTGKALAYFERAVAIAQAQQSKSLELRASMSIARLWRVEGKQDEARALLAPLYGQFTQGFDTLDLQQAKALLDALG
jgi:predicted ATPase